MAGRAEPASLRSARRPPRRSAAPTSSPPSRRRRGCSRELPRPAGRVLFAGAEGARRLLVDELGADFVPLYRTRELEPGRRRRRATSSCSPRPRPRAPSPGSARRPAGDRIGPQTTAAALGRPASACSPRPRRTTSTALVAAANLPRVFVTFLSDFGLQDDFVGTCHGVIKRIAPEMQIIDITHGIPAQQVLQGALVLANTLPYMPDGVHLAVVDPGVGSSTARARAARRRRPALRRPGQRAARPGGRAGRRSTPRHELTNPRLRARDGLAHVPRTRPLRAGGRAPLARRADSRSSARRSRSTSSSGSTCRSPRSRRRRIVATVLYVDRFGNVAAQPDPRAPRARSASSRARRSSSSSAATATTRSRRARSPTRGRATSCSTRTATGTCRSRSAAATRPRCCTCAWASRSGSTSMTPDSLSCE